MGKKIFLGSLLVGLIGVLLFGAYNRTLAKSESGNNGRGNGGQTLDEAAGNGYAGGGAGTGVVQNGGYGRGGDNALDSVGVISAAQDGLTEAEKEALIFMREEEKLAHDVYQVLYERWGLPVFLNIGSSEQSHMDAVEVLLDRYDLPDPAAGGPGVFTNPDLQALYGDLVAQGEQSLSDALMVGAAIEEIDILDLQERLAQTDHVDIKQVFTNLLNGSSNHLRAFAATLLSQTGEAYQPQFMSADEYQAVAGDTGAGFGQGRGAQGAGRGRRP